MRLKWSPSIHFHFSYVYNRDTAIWIDTSDFNITPINNLRNTSVVLPTCPHQQLCKVVIMGKMHHVYTFVQLGVRLPDWKIIVFASEMDNPSFLCREEVHVFKGLPNVRLDKACILCR